LVDEVDITGLQRLDLQTLLRAVGGVPYLGGSALTRLTS
jgi:hypothetical protein